MPDTGNYKSIKIHLKLTIGLCERFIILVNILTNLAELSECVGAGFITWAFTAQVITCTLHSVHALQNKSWFWALYWDKSDTGPGS